MKTLARIGAILSVVLSAIPAFWLLTKANLGEEPIAGLIGLFLLSFACFSGATLWIQGERCHIAQARFKSNTIERTSS